MASAAKAPALFRAPPASGSAPGTVPNPDLPQPERRASTSHRGMEPPPNTPERPSAPPPVDISHLQRRYTHPPWGSCPSGPALARRRGPADGRRCVSFCEVVMVLPTWPKEIYDRTSADEAVLTKADIQEVINMRLAFLRQTPATPSSSTPSSEDRTLVEDDDVHTPLGRRHAPKSGAASPASLDWDGSASSPPRTPSLDEADTSTRDDDLPWAQHLWHNPWSRAHATRGVGRSRRARGSKSVFDSPGQADEDIIELGTWNTHHSDTGRAPELAATRAGGGE